MGPKEYQGRICSFLWWGPPLQSRESLDSIHIKSLFIVPLKYCFLFPLYGETRDKTKITIRISLPGPYKDPRYTWVEPSFSYSSKHPILLFLSSFWPRKRKNAWPSEIYCLPQASSFTVGAHIPDIQANYVIGPNMEKGFKIPPSNFGFTHNFLSRFYKTSKPHFFHLVILISKHLFMVSSCYSFKTIYMEELDEVWDSYTTMIH